MGEKELRARVLILERQVAEMRAALLRLQDEVASMQQKEAVDDGAAAPDFFKALTIENARVVGGPHKAGDAVTISYELVNGSMREHVIPMQPSYHRQLVGILQHWIERGDEDPTVPAIPAKIKREGRRYAAGGHIVPWGDKLLVDERKEYRRRIDTTGYPTGNYIYYIQVFYKHGDAPKEIMVPFELE